MISSPPPCPWRAVVRRLIRAGALGLGICCAGSAMAGTVTLPRNIAVIYAENDEPWPGEYSELIAAIENNPEVVVYRIALRDTTDVASDFPSSQRTRSRPTTVAFNDSDGAIAVIYPDIGEPYRSIFSQIIEGIEEKARTRVAAFAIGANANPADISSELKKNNIRVVITLGRNGLKTANAFGRDVNVICGGVITAPDTDVRGLTVMSLAPDPGLLFGRLKTLKPTTKRVVVVFDPKQNTWLIRLARDAAAANGLELVAYEATDLKSSMRIYQEVLTNIDPAKEALWLPQDTTTVEESSALPYLLQEAWTRGLLVFSSNVAHVKRGALFSLYPNNQGLGRSLANSAISQAGTATARGLVPLKEVLVAVNIRTATHLGINTGAKQGFDMVFPEK